MKLKEKNIEKKKIFLEKLKGEDGRRFRKTSRKKSWGRRESESFKTLIWVNPKDEIMFLKKKERFNHLMPGVEY